MIVVEYPACLHKIAEQMGNARGLMNQYKNRPKKYDREDKNDYVNTIGVLGELIILHFLEESKIEYKMVNLVDNYSSKNADFVVNNQRLDVKCKADNYPTFILHKESHTKGKGLIDYYVFVYVKSKTTAEIHKFSYQDVEEWQEKDLKYGTVKYIAIN